MDTLTAIHTRRSIRKYESKSVPESDINALLEAAMMAPSAGNEQPWHFVVITDPEKLDAIVPIHHYAAMAAQSPVSILICGDLTLEKYTGFWIQDCSAAMQNLLLAAHAMGLGAVWCGVYPVEDRISGFRKLFQLPDSIIPFGLAVIGYPAQSRDSKSRYKVERVHTNTW